MSLDMAILGPSFCPACIFAFFSRCSPSQVASYSSYGARKLLDCLLRTIGPWVGCLGLEMKRPLSPWESYNHPSCVLTGLVLLSAMAVFLGDAGLGFYYLSNLV